MPRPRFWFWSYGPSNSVNQLIDALNGRIIRKQHSRYRRNYINDIIVNWGTRNCPFLGALNEPAAVDVASSKIHTFQRLQSQGVPTPPFTTDRSVAEDWVQRGRVLGRDHDRGSQGSGITVYERHSTVGQHRFYTRYMRRDREIRVHVFQNQVIFQQEKLRGRERNVNPYIGSHRFGWVFAFHHFGERPVPESVLDVSQRAVSTLGLDFGAVDVVWNSRSNAATVLEVNTAPGLENSSLEAYINAFRRLL